MDILRVLKYRGCGKCKLCSNSGCAGEIVPVKITFLKPQVADDWGRMVTVFNKGDVVQGKARIKDNIVYCVTARSTIYDDYEDYIDTSNIKVELVK